MCNFDTIRWPARLSSWNVDTNDAGNTTEEPGLSSQVTEEQADSESP